MPLNIDSASSAIPGFTDSANTCGAAAVIGEAGGVIRAGSFIASIDEAVRA